MRSVGGRVAPFTLIVAVLLLVAGCGGGSGGSSTTDTSEAANPARGSTKSPRGSSSNDAKFSPEDLDVLSSHLEERGFEVGEPAEGIPHYTDGISAVPTDTAPEGTVLIFLYTTAAEARKAEPLLKCQKEEREVKQQLVEEGMMKESDVTCLTGNEGGFAFYIEGVPVSSTDQKAFSEAQEVVREFVSELE